MVVFNVIKKLIAAGKISFIGVSAKQKLYVSLILIGTAMIVTLVILFYSLCISQ